MDKKSMIVALLRRFAAQRSGIEYGNYGDPVAFRAECRSIAKDGREARELIRAVELANGLSEETLRAAFRAFSGRLVLTDRSDGSLAIDYCTGQYFPTEYRRAVCAVCSAALWDYFRDGFAESAKPGESEGDAIRRNFRQMFGRGMANRWFN